MVYAIYIRDRVNVELFVHVLSVILVHRKDTRHLFVPLHWQVFPRKFVNFQDIKKAEMIANIFEDPGNRVSCIAFN